MEKNFKFEIGQEFSIVNHNYNYGYEIKVKVLEVRTKKGYTYLKAYFTEIKAKCLDYNHTPALISMLNCYDYNKSKIVFFDVNGNESCCLDNGNFWINKDNLIK